MGEGYELGKIDVPRVPTKWTWEKVRDRANRQVPVKRTSPIGIKLLDLAYDFGRRPLQCRWQVSHHFAGECCDPFLLRLDPLEALDRVHRGSGLDVFPTETLQSIPQGDRVDVPRCSPVPRCTPGNLRRDVAPLLIRIADESRLRPHGRGLG